MATKPPTRRLFQHDQLVTSCFENHDLDLAGRTKTETRGQSNGKNEIEGVRAMWVDS